MLKKLVFVMALAIATLTASGGFALWLISDKGTWPESWPKPLDPLRPRSHTYTHDAQVVYVIPFSERSDFESAWPHILALKSKQAPLVLRSSPDTWLGTPLTAGVRIHCPKTGELLDPQGTKRYPPGVEPAIDDRNFLKVGPPWPSDIESASGTLPEYAFIKDGKWRAWDGKQFAFPDELPQALSLRRARTEIELIVDGKIVDLNRIALPADTPIVDKRFPGGSEVTVGRTSEPPVMEFRRSQMTLHDSYPGEPMAIRLCGDEVSQWRRLDIERGMKADELWRRKLLQEYERECRGGPTPPTR